MGSILDAMETALEAAIGTGSGATHEIATANFIQRKFPWDVNVNLPGVTLVPVPEIEKPATNASDDIGYGVQVTIAQTSNRKLSANADRLYYWREQAMATFRRPPGRLSGVSVVYTLVIEPKAVVDPSSFVGQVDATAFVVRCWARVQRP
jgi:hypothetical protein